MTLPNSSFWDDLLQAMEDGSVVPVVGRDLLVVDDGRGPELFQHVLARRLAAELNVPTELLPPGFDINDVLCSYEQFKGDADWISPRVVTLARKVKFPPPEPLRLLAEIPVFKLFVSTTFDTLLEEALASARMAPPTTVAFPSPSSSSDFNESLLRRHDAVVFQILGRLSASSQFAMTEGQVLEMMHLFMADEGSPKKLLAMLRESHLLLLGVSFPDWLARFLLRVARAKPLWDSRHVMEFIADSGRGREEFAVFLRHFSPRRSRLYDGSSPNDFVRELHRRWFERHPAATSSATPPALPGVRPQGLAMEPGSVFICYTNEDQKAAFRLAERLTALGVETWVDRQLQPGNDYRRIIERHISRDCAAFVPLLSRHTQAKTEGFFRREWELACDRAKNFYAAERAFIFPVVIDNETRMRSADETGEAAFRRTAALAVDGEPPDSLAAQLSLAQKEWRIAKAGKK